MASTLPIDRASAVGGKGAFANRARRFVKSAARVVALPGYPFLWVGCAVAAILMIVTGGFGTGQLPLGLRTLFWALLLGWNLTKWQAWFALTVRKPADWMRAAPIGGLLLNLLIPLEINVCLRAIGIHTAIRAPEVWGSAFVISLVLFAPIYLMKRRLWPNRPVAAFPDKGLLARAGATAETLVAVAAEDHYCRVHRRDGSSALVHYRFSDALAELAALEGAQVHRGAWVAASAVRGAVRERRRWRLLLCDGRHVSVSASHLAAVRARGWLWSVSIASNRPKTQSAVAFERSAL